MDAINLHPHSLVNNDWDHLSGKRLSLAINNAIVYQIYKSKILF